jgi:hypothetical protein
MRFICPEIEPKENCWLDLFYRTADNINSINDNGVLKTKSQTIYIEGKPYYLFGSDFQDIYINTYLKQDLKAKTIAEFDTLTGINLVDNLSALASTFNFNIEKLIEMKSSFWYTIFTDSDIRFYKPVRSISSDYLGVIKDDVIINKTFEEEKNIDYYNESSADAYISLEKDSNVMPTLINDTLKSLALNKYYSGISVITFFSNRKANLLDFVIYENDIYIILSETQNDKGYNYTAVKEANASYSFSSGDIVIEDGGGGSFLSLSDTPSSYTDCEGFILKVNSAGNAVEFIDGKDHYEVGVEHLTNKVLTNGATIKPVYRKVIDCGTLPNTTAKYISIGESDLDKSWIINGWANNPTTGQTVTIPRPSVDVDATIESNTNIRITTSANYTAFTESYVTIEYTKTTD